MSEDKMRAILGEELAEFRSWEYSKLAERVRDTGTEHLECAERTAADGTKYAIDVEAFWDDRPGEAIRVAATLWAEPKRRLFGFLPIYMPHVSDCFIMGPDGRFIGEESAQAIRPSSGMKSVVLVLSLFGFMSVVFGFVSCVHYYSVNPPPEAFQPGWNPDAQTAPFDAFSRCFFSVAGGIVALALAFYLAGRMKHRG